jgi:hypothetical protein
VVTTYQIGDRAGQYISIPISIVEANGALW